MKGEAVPREMRRLSQKPCADPAESLTNPAPIHTDGGERWGVSVVLWRGETGVGGSGEAHKEDATSDWRRGSGTMCAPVVNNGATHLESYMNHRDIAYSLSEKW